MMWTARYIPPSETSWQGRPDVPHLSCFYQRIHLLDLQKSISNINTPSIALLGFCCDEGIRRNFGRVGAENGPQSLREVLARFPIHNDLTCYDVGDIICDDNNLEASQSALSEAVHLLLKHHITPIVIGGGHEVAWGHYQGIAKQIHHENLSIINIDAHFDMRPLLKGNLGSSGTPFLQIANAEKHHKEKFNYYCIGIQPSGNLSSLFTTAKKYHTQIIYADDIHQDKTQKIDKLLNQIIHDSKIIYLSLCLDVFATAYAPGVSAPQILGLTPWQVIPIVRKLAESGKVISFDIAELSPPHDIDLRTAKLGASLVYEIIHHQRFLK